MSEPAGTVWWEGAAARRWALAWVLAAVALSYGGTFRGELVYDAAVIVGSDPRLRSASVENVGLILSGGYWFPVQSGDLYRPLTTLSYWFNYTVLGHGDDAAGYRVVNLLLHLVSVTLVYSLARRWLVPERVSAPRGGRFPDWLAPAGAAALFGLHPMATEVVANVVGRADLLATLAVLGALRCQWNVVERPLAGGTAIAVLGVLGVAAKESAVVLAPALLLQAWRFGLPPWGGAAPRRRGLAWALPVLPGLVLFAWARWRFAELQPPAGQLFLDNPLATSGWLEGRLVAARIWLDSTLAWCLPLRQAADFSWSAEVPRVGSWIEAGFWRSVLGIVMIAGAAWAAVDRRAGRWGFLVGFWLLGSLPTSNLLVVIGSIRAERFWYLPAVAGAATVAALLLSGGSRKTARVAGGAALVALALAAGLATRSRARVWLDGATFWNAALAAQPQSFRALRGAAREIFRQATTESEVDRAIELGEIALAVLKHPQVPAHGRDPWVAIELGLYHLEKARWLDGHGEREAGDAAARRAETVTREGLAVLAGAAAVAPGRRLARGAEPPLPDPTAWLTLGAVAFRFGRVTEAVEHWRTAARWHPLLASPAARLARVAEQRGDVEGALVWTVRALLADPGAAAAQLEAAAEEKRWAERGWGAFAGGLALDPRVPAMARALELAVAGIEEDLQSGGQAVRAAKFRRQITERFGGAVGFSENGTGPAGSRASEAILTDGSGCSGAGCRRQRCP